MPRLHAARINVLREKQARQLERIQAKQEVELRAAVSEMETALANQESQFDAEARHLQRDRWRREERIRARWALVEAIERRRLECETGLPFAPLPPLPWPEGREMQPQAGMESMALSLAMGDLAFYKGLPPRPGAHREYTV